jgi:hypothetical protein
MARSGIHGACAHAQEQINKQTHKHTHTHTHTHTQEVPVAIREYISTVLQCEIVRIIGDGRCCPRAVAKSSGRVDDRSLRRGWAVRSVVGDIVETCKDLVVQKMKGKKLSQKLREALGNKNIPGPRGYLSFGEVDRLRKTAFEFHTGAVWGKREQDPLRVSQYMGRTALAILAFKWKRPFVLFGMYAEAPAAVKQVRTTPR